ncbi:hypothetical protein C2G38_2155269 [Gigaspora rosea]|uniref:Uncharacterized protein n=1 Tax=Gigaspora rosea TaxID=44941 RepID=A0A397W438_9GLOM|nr:hypothetical protein C2G38_2155269 [Gigaspora rosea]
MATKLFERLSNDYLELLDDKKDFNVIISTENQDASFIVECMRAACEFPFKELVKYLETHLIETNPPLSTVINERHGAEIASWVDKKAEAYSVIIAHMSFNYSFVDPEMDLPENHFGIYVISRQILLIIKVNSTFEILVI